MANFPEKLNEPALKVGGITGTGTGRVDLKADQATRSAMERYAPLVDFAKTLQQVGPAVAQIQDLEHKQSKARKMYESEIESIKGLEKDGLISEHALEQFLTEEQGRLQRTGYIRAYENLMIQEEVDKQRANIRLAAYGTEMEKLIPLMTNPDPQFRLSYDEAAQRVYGVFAEATANGRAVGTDSFGNPVMFNPDELSSGELIALTRGLTEMRNQYSIKIEQDTHQKAIDGMAQNLAVNVASTIGATVGGAISSEEGMAIITEEFNKAYNFGVTEINDRFITSVRSFGESISSRPGASQMEYVSFMQFLDDVESGLVLRKNEKGEDVLFAPEGTENHLKLEQIRDQFNTDWNQTRTAEAKKAKDEYEYLEDRLFEAGVDMLIDISGGGVTDDEYRQINLDVINAAKEMGVRGTDKILNRLDAVAQNIKAAKDNPNYRALVLTEIETERYDSNALDAQLSDAHDMLQAGMISLDDYTAIRSAVRSAKGDIKTNESSGLAAKITEEGGLGFSGGKDDIERAMQDVLKTNDERINLGNAAFPNYVTVRGHDNMPNPDYVSNVEEWLYAARDVAVNGGRVDAVEVVPFTEREIEILGEMQYNEAMTAGVLNSLKRALAWDAPVTTESQARTRGAAIRAKARQYASYLALRQAIDMYMSREQLINNTWSMKGQK